MDPVEGINYFLASLPRRVSVRYVKAAGRAAEEWLGSVVSPAERAREKRGPNRGKKGEGID
jgi:hypothetical protein